MNDSKISLRYAKALFLQAKEENCENDVREDLKSLLECINSAQEFNQLLNSPVVSLDEKIKIFLELFSGKFCNLTLNFIKLLVKNKRESFLKIICLDYETLYTQENNIKSVKVTTATKASDDLGQKIKALINQKYPGSTVEINLIEQPEIIGGIKIEVDDIMYDASVSTRLKKIKEKLVNKK